MPAGMRHESNWTYWSGRALAAKGEAVGSRAYYLRIAGQPDFYGLLAAEELGYVSTLPDAVYVPTEAEVDAARQDRGLARALDLIRLGMRKEGVREWLFSVRYFDDAKLLAASEFARRERIWDRSIQAADRTVRAHNFALRYPMPFREVFTEYAKAYELDESWILGIVRQESRFITDARSAAGAAGLMQVMPRTARFIAQRIRLPNYQRKGVTEVATNVTLGAGYLRLVLDQLGSQGLAADPAGERRRGGRGHQPQGRARPPGGRARCADQPGRHPAWRLRGGACRATARRHQRMPQRRHRADPACQRPRRIARRAFRVLAYQGERRAGDARCRRPARHHLPSVGDLRTRGPLPQPVRRDDSILRGSGGALPAGSLPAGVRRRCRPRHGGRPRGNRNLRPAL